MRREVLIYVDDFHSRNHLVTKQEALMRVLHENKTRKIQTEGKPMTDCPVRRKRFFNVQEYADVICDSDTSDVLSEVSGTATEGGYLSDVSEGLFTLRDNAEKTNSRKRRTKGELDNRRHFKLTSTSETDDFDSPPKFVRKVRNKEPKNTANNYDYKNTDDGKLLYALEDDLQKRRSWTDSGVSLSRTDQSRSGTIRNDKSPSPPKLESPRARNINRDQMIRIRLFLADENPEDLDGDSSFKETDAGELSEKGYYESETILTPNFVKRRNENSEKQDHDFNRFSVITDKSSLTNVTILSRNPSISSTISSLSGCTSVNYTTSATETTKQPETDEESEEEQNEEISDDDNYEDVNTMKTEISINTKETQIVNQLIQNAKMMEEKQVSNLKESKLPDFHGQSSCENRKRSKSILSGLKKVKAQLKPRFLSSKHYKDASSEFLYAKTEKEKNNAAFDELTAHVFGKLKQLQVSESNNSISRAVSDSSLHKIQNSSADELQNRDKQMLEKLGSRPSKQNSFLKKIFRRSRSYSAERIMQKSKQKALPSEYSSARSFPDQLNTTRTDNERANSFEHTGFNQICSSKSSNDIDSFNQKNIPYDHHVRLQHRVEYSSSEHLPRVRSLTSIDDVSSSVVAKPRAKSTPNTPVTFRSAPSPSYEIYGLNSYENDCDCDECRYADYLDFLAFQQFRRNGGFKNIFQPSYHTPSSSNYYTTTPPYLMHTTNSQSYPINVEHESLYTEKHDNIIAPLSVTVEKEREAKKLKTAMYDTFV